MITELKLIESGFEKISDSHYSIHIGGPWYLHILKEPVYDHVMAQYGNQNMYHGESVSIWATFTDIEKLKQLIELLKGDKK